MSNIPHIIDLFCGCGGFGLGAELAGFRSIAAIDIDETLQSAYKYNFPETRVIQGDLSTMNQNSWRLILNNGQADGVIGGPPCQGFSRIGVRNPNDPRRSLLNDFFRHINILQPKFFVMENVEGLLDKSNRYELEVALSIVDQRYTVLSPFIIDASNYGAPTKRKRVIVVGFDKNCFTQPLIKADFLPSNLLTQTTVREAILDLPSPFDQTEVISDFGWKSYRSNKNLSSYAQMLRAQPCNHIGNPEAKGKLKRRMTSGHFNTSHGEEVKSRFRTLKMGQIDKVGRAKRLDWDGLCPTLRAGTGVDKGSYQATRPIHPSEDRVITVREAARLQGFPDWFCFHYTKWHSFRMIGNSVSPIVSKYVLSKIKEKLITSKETIQLVSKF